MNLTVFPVSTTNIFPISNSHAGGQLLTEFNLRSRESVGTDPAVTYSIGPSYVHSLDDFDVTLELDGSGVPISTSAIMISPGKAVVNGHYIESLTPITIDIDECNARLVSLGQTALKGKLCVGLRVMYSTEQTMNGAMQVENSIGLYTGIQVVILPKEGSGEVFTTPSDSPTDESKVNAHIKLAEFSFSNGTVSSIKRNDDKISMFTADRISSINSFISDIYVKKTGLDPWKIYTYAGNGADTQYDTWCDSMDSLMVWDNDPHTVAGAPNGVQSATFWYNPLTDKVVLQLPHKQPDGGIYGTDGNQRHYEDKILNLPSANYGLCTGGVVTKAYTSAVRDIDNKIQTFYRLPQGKMRYYYDGVLTEKAKEKQFPQIYDNCTWTPGDYILVSQDATVQY